MASPMLKGTDLPIEERGRLQVRPDLRVGTADDIVADAWGAGDVSAVPDLSGGGVGGFCVPNAQHAVRQGRLMAKNIVAALRGEALVEYNHKNAGAVAGLGLGVGAFQSGKIAVKGLPAWFMHRGYHGLAMPTWERKIRVIGNWVFNFVLGRDIASLEARVTPRAAFETFASRPRPAADTPAPAPAAAPATAPATSSVPSAQTEPAPAAKKPAAKRAPKKTAEKDLPSPEGAPIVVGGGDPADSK
jgi:NADH dehydrogenase